MGALDIVSHTEKDKKDILCKFYDAIMEVDIWEEGQYWKRIFECLHENEKEYKLFFRKSEWDKIKDWIEKKSFKYNSKKEMMEEKFSEIIEKYEAFFALSNSSNIFDFARAGELCFDYLNAYYVLIISMEQNGLLRDDLSYDPSFLAMMMTGYIDLGEASKTGNSDSGEAFKTGNNDSGEASKIGYSDLGEVSNRLDKYFYGFYSPIFLENICLFYDFLLENYKSYAGPSKKIKWVCDDIVRKKFVKMFFSDINIAGKRYATTYYGDKCLCLMNRDYLSSIEPIRPIRWIDKIRSYIDYCQNTSKKFTENENGSNIINIAAIGYVKLVENAEGKLCSDELELFGKVLNSLFEKKNIYLILQCWLTRMMKITILRIK